MIPEEGFQRGLDFVKERFPALADAPILETRACHYESSVTRNFIIDEHPDWQNAWITGGGSAEAFKQGPVLGEYIAHRILDDDLEPELAEGFRLSDETFDEDEGP
jgi:glycine/D-amino acid oxidase-like deaminating enzyme